MTTTKKAFVLLFLGIALSLAVYAASYYQVLTGTPLNITEFSSCRTVTNNNAQTLFVPTNTQTEWNTFETAIITNVTLACCDGSKTCP